MTPRDRDIILQATTRAVETIGTASHNRVLLAILSIVFALSMTFAGVCAASVLAYFSYGLMADGPARGQTALVVFFVVVIAGAAFGISRGWIMYRAKVAACR